MPLTGRSYDVALIASARDDIAQTQSGATYFLEAFNRLSDHDILDWAPLPIPAGEEGAWVCFRMGDAVVMAQWDKGNPALWNVGFGRGFLKVVRVVPPEQFEAAVEAMTGSDE